MGKGKKSEKALRKVRKTKKKFKKMKRLKDNKISLNLGFLHELGIASSPERDSEKESKKGGNPSYRSGVENNRTGRSYNKLFSAGGWDLEKSPVKRDEPYISNGSRDDFLPQNIDVHVNPPGISDKPQEQKRMHKHGHKSKYPCGGRLRAYFHRTEYASHYNIPGESGYGEISILNRFPVHGRRL